VSLNPVLDQLGTYPFARLTEAKRQVSARGVELIDLGIGEPREETPAFIRRALAEAVEAEPVSTYPLSEGLPELRAAIAAWAGRRFGAALDPDTEVVPTFGSKEAIFHLPQLLVDRDGGRDLVAVTSPGYPVPARGAAFAGAGTVALPLDADAGWLPALDLDDSTWRRLTVLFVNYPNNPTGATVTLEWLEALAARCRAHGVVLACDEAYSEVWLEGPAPESALGLLDRSGVIVFNTLSKRSSMPGYRSGFVAGDPVLVAAIKRYRPSVGLAPPAFVQRASVAAWGDEAHVEATRARYGAKRDVLLPALTAAGLEPAGGPATFFLWLRVPPATEGPARAEGRATGDDEALAARWLERGVVVTPGSYLGATGAGYVRVALVPTVEACARAAALVAGDT